MEKTSGRASADALPPPTAAGKTDLSRFNNDWYRPGPRWKIVLWFLCNALLLKSYLPIPVGLKVRLLRAFGARVGRGVMIKPGVNIKYPWLLSVGNHVWIGENVWIDNLAPVTLGSHVCLSQGAMLLTGNHNYRKPTFDLIVKPIRVDEGGWVGAQATVCPGVTVGSHALLAVGSVATRNMDAYGIYQGNPGRVGAQTGDFSVKISVITVVYNGVDTLRDTIESVLGQSYAPIEYLIIDGGSTDGTVALVNEYGSKIAQFITEPDRGLYDAMNKGLARATGEVIGFLNADDFYRHPEVITHVVASLTQSGSDAVYGDMLYVDRQDTAQIRRYWRSGPYRPGQFLWGWMPGHLSFFARKWVYDQYGGFRLDLRSAADYELMLRFIHRHQIRLTYMAETTIVMREGGVSNQSLTNRLRANRDDRRAWSVNGLKPYFFTQYLKPLRKISQLFQRE